MYSIYIKDLTIHDFNLKCKNLLKLKEIKNYKLLYSDLGIYKIDNDLISKNKILIKNPKSLNINSYNIIINFTENKLITIFSQIPNDYDLVTIKKYIYTLPDINNFYFINIFENDELVDTFIESTENYDLNKIKKKLVSFLSL